MSFQHRDAFGRTKEVAKVDAGREFYLRPIDGKLKPLRVQGFTRSTPSDDSCTWVRTGEPKDRLPPIIKILQWTFS